MFAQYRGGGIGHISTRKMDKNSRKDFDESLPEQQEHPGSSEECNNKDEDDLYDWGYVGDGDDEGEATGSDGESDGNGDGNSGGNGNSNGGDVDDEDREAELDEGYEEEGYACL
jgi:hypothetical protein